MFDLVFSFPLGATAPAPVGASSLDMIPRCRSLQVRYLAIFIDLGFKIKHLNRDSCLCFKMMVHYYSVAFQ